MTFGERFKLYTHYLLPKHFLTRLAGYFADKRCGWLTRFAIQRFIKAYQVDMQEAAEPSVRAYATFNDFFTRALKADARPFQVTSNALIQPVDGAISQFGPLHDGALIQAKNHSYSLTDLLGKKDTWSEQFQGGEFATLYLAPKDYHRIHMPCDAVLREMRYIPGRLFSVNPFTAEHVPNLFAKNERVVALFDTEHGPLSLVLVGATIVGSIETTWAGTLNNPRSKQVHTWHYPAEGKQAIHFKQGDEMGRFKLGSTVILTFAAGQIEWDEQITIGATTRMGRALAKRAYSAQTNVAETSYAEPDSSEEAE